MKNQIEVKRLKSDDAFNALQSEWYQLLSQSLFGDIFLTWEWLFAWWKAFGDANELWLLTVRENGVLIGIAPLMLKTHRKLFFKLRVLSNIGTPQCDVSGFIATKKELVIEEIHKYLKKHKDKWDIFEMKVLPKSAYEADRLPDIFQKDGGYKTIQKADKHYYLPINSSWENYFKSLSKNLRRNLKRRLKRAEELGAVNHKWYIGKRLKWDQFLTIFELNKKGSYPTLYESKRNRAFHRLLYELMNEKGWIQIEILCIDNEPVAFQYGYIFNNRYQDWRGGYNAKYETLGVGKILMMFSIQKWFKAQIQEVDFLRGTHAYKADWQPLTRDFIDLRIFRVQRIETLIAYTWLNTIKPIIRQNWLKNILSTDEIS